MIIHLRYFSIKNLVKGCYNLLISLCLLGFGSYAFAADPVPCGNM